MTAAAKALAAELRAILKEIKPYGQHEHREFSDELLALGILLQRQIDRKIDKLPTRHADGTEPSITAKPSKTGRKPR